MNLLKDDLLSFTHAIVRGEKLAPTINATYLSYSASNSIEIYRNNYRGNLHDALAGAYPVIEQLVGQDFFRQLTKTFIEKYFSRSGNLHHYGAQMADFVATFPSAQKLVYLSDVAVLEWACHCAYFAPDAATLDINKLAQIPPEQYPKLILHTHPACHVVRSPYPISAIWHAHQPGAPVDFHIDLDSGPSRILVSRKEDVVHVSELQAGDAEWLLNIQSGATFGTATAATLENYPDFDLQACLSSLVSQGVFTNFDLGEMQ